MVCFAGIQNKTDKLSSGILSIRIFTSFPGSDFRPSDLRLDNPMHQLSRDEDNAVNWGSFLQFLKSFPHNFPKKDNLLGSIKDPILYCKHEKFENRWKYDLKQVAMVLNLSYEWIPTYLFIAIRAEIYFRYSRNLTLLCFPSQPKLPTDFHWESISSWSSAALSSDGIAALMCNKVKNFLPSFAIC